MGVGGNIVVLAEPDGVVLVDCGIVGARVAATVATLTAVPIRDVVNTHWHFDHTDANAWLAVRGATIVAHENTRRHLSQATRVEDFDFTFPPVAASGLPRTVFGAEHALEVGKTTLTLRHYSPAHTDADISVQFDQADVLQVGDTWWNGSYPFIDYSTGGSIDGLIAATDTNLTMASSGTMIIPGHGPVGNRARLMAYREMLVTVRERVARLKGQGLTVGQHPRRSGFLYPPGLPGRVGAGRPALAGWLTTLGGQHDAHTEDRLSRVAGQPARWRRQPNDRSRACGYAAHHEDADGHPG